ncbi:AMIN domain-containing protein, partial [Candidatus Dependentiae bacterium]|nr:AMIN domain-containing protein [Candidatus Dependentiae bacterium]
MKKKTYRFLMLNAIIFLILINSLYAAVSVKPFLLKFEQNNGKIVFRLPLNDSVTPEIFSLPEEKKIVADLTGCRWNQKKGETKTVIGSGSAVKQVRFGQFKNNVARMVFDLEDNAEYIYSHGGGILVITIGKNTVLENSGNNGDPKPTISENIKVFSKPVQIPEKNESAENSAVSFPSEKKNTISKSDEFVKKEISADKNYENSSLNSGNSIKIEKKDNLISLDLKEAELQNVLRLLSQSAGMNIIASSEITGKVTVSLKNTPLTKVLDSILKVNGYGYVIDGDLIKVVPANRLSSMPEPYKTKIFKIQYAAADEINKPVKSILSSNGIVEVLPSSNSIMITDLQEYLDKAESVVKLLDSKDIWEKRKEGFYEETKIIKLKYVIASNVKNILQKMSSTRSGIVEADDNINALIITGVKNYVKQVTEIVDKIDIATRNDIEKLLTKIYYLRYSKAEEIKDALEKIFSSQIALTANKNNYFKVVVDQRTNSVIVNTNIQSFLEKLSEIINELDRPVKQVLIEAKFIEVGLDKDNSLGINWSQFGNVNIQSSPDLMTVNLKDWKPTYGTLSVKQFNLVLKNLDSNSNLNLLSSPRITTIDNKKAMIKISDNIVTDVQTTESQSGNITQTPLRSEVGIILEVLPHINNDTYITLELAPQVNEARASVLSTGVDIIKREAKTTVVVKNGNTIALGGLIKNVVNTTNAGVPFLNKIPLV